MSPSPSVIVYFDSETEPENIEAVLQEVFGYCGLEPVWKCDGDEHLLLGIPKEPPPPPPPPPPGNWVIILETPSPIQLLARQEQFLSPLPEIRASRRFPRPEKVLWPRIQKGGFRIGRRGPTFRKK